MNGELRENLWNYLQSRLPLTKPAVCNSWSSPLTIGTFVAKYPVLFALYYSFHILLSKTVAHDLYRAPLFVQCPFDYNTTYCCFTLNPRDSRRHFTIILAKYRNYWFMNYLSY